MDILDENNMKITYAYGFMCCGYSKKNKFCPMFEDFIPNHPIIL